MPIDRNALAYSAKINPSLDGIRGTAALLVFLSHSSWAGQTIWPSLHFGGIGHVGVYLFFVLSAYLVTISFERDNCRLAPFFLRRASRILPLYYLVITATYLSGSAPDGLQLYVNGGFEGYIRHLLFLQGDIVFWSIPPEVIFYATVPGLVWIVRRFGVIGCIGIAVAALAYYGWYVLYTAKYASIRPTYLYMHHDSQWIDCFLLGFVAAKLRDGSSRDWLDRNKAVISFIVQAAFVLLLLATLICASQRFLWWTEPLPGLRWVSLLYGVVFAALVLVCDLWPTRLGALFHTALLRYFGLISFSLYLLHLPAINIVSGLTWLQGLPALQFVFSLTLATLFSTVTFRLIEEPSFRWSRRILDRQKQVVF